MPRSATALVEPEMLAWAREAAHLDRAIAAKKLGIPEERLQAWESGYSRPTVKQLRRLAHIYRQSFAVFYLPHPPDDRLPKLRDYRRLPGGAVEGLSYDLLLELRTAVDWRSIALELLELEGVDPPRLELVASLGEDPELVADRVRACLGVSLDDQLHWGNNRIAFNAWRDAAEQAGMLVFQARGIAVEEMRGLSVSEHPLPIVVVNRKDAYAGRIFSLLHEVAHLALHVTGVCDLTTEPRPAEEQRFEVFCNHVAGATIVPRQALMQAANVGANRRPCEWSDEKLTRLASHFCTSREVILRRLLALGHTTQSFYERERQRYAEELESRPRRKGFLPPPSDVVSAAGKPLVRLVLSAFYADRITANDVSDYLGVRLKHLPALTESVGA